MSSSNIIIKGGLAPNGVLELSMDENGGLVGTPDPASREVVPAAAAGGPSLIYISTGMNATTGAIQTVPDTVNATFFSGKMPACTVKNFRLETSSHGDPINVVVENQATSETLEFEATSAGTLAGEDGLVFEAGQGMTIRGANSAPGESGAWSMRGIFEVHPA